VGILKIEKDGTWKDLSDGRSTTVHHQFTLPAFKTLQRGVLTKALEALDDIPFEKRDQSSMTLSFSSEAFRQ